MPRSGAPVRVSAIRSTSLWDLRRQNPSRRRFSCANNLFRAPSFHPQRSDGETPMTTRRPLIAGNWKMNGLRASRQVLADIVAGAAGLSDKVDVMVCPPTTLVMLFAPVGAGVVAIGGQNCHAEPCGAFTGDISAEMLADA